MNKSLPLAVMITAAIFSFFSPVVLEASSHREAPFMTTVPKLDITDFYMFQSYDIANVAEADANLRRTTLIMNFHPLQDAFGGPNYFFADENARYRINVDNDGDGVEDIVFEIDFNFKRDNFRKLALNTGAENTEIPLIALPLNLDQVEEEADAQLNVVESYKMRVIKDGVTVFATNNDNIEGNSNFVGTKDFVKPLDNIGDTTIEDYDAYVRQHVYEFEAFGEIGKVFVGQRNDPFVVNLGEIFDGANIVDGGDTITAKNITSFCVEVPNSFLALDGDAVANDVFAGWSTTRARGQTNVFFTVGSGNLQNNGLPEGGTIFKQVSRLGMPLVNEVVIGLRFKDRFNNSVPRNDNQFAGFVANSSLAAILNAVDNGNVNITAAPTENRADLVAIFATGANFAGAGVGQVNNFFGPGVAEYQRLDVQIPPVTLDQQNVIGLIAGDDAGFPNGRRPKDDVVDIALRVVAGEVISIFDAAQVGDDNAAIFTDGADVVDATEGFDNPLGQNVVEFPFLGTPISGDPVNAK